MSEWTVDTLKAHFDALRIDDKDALRVALQEAKEKAASHNDLIREGQRKEALYVTKSELYASVLAAAAIVGTIVTVLNLVLK
jgi:hypothetical protein